MTRALELLLLLAAPMLGADVAALDRFVSRYHDFGMFDGAVLVAADGDVVFKKAYGLADREWNIPNETDTRFRIGSITKQFTAALILQLVDEGLVELDAPLSRYLPEYPDKIRQRITVHQLLTHTSGLGDYTMRDGFLDEISRVPHTPAEFMKSIAAEPLDSPPGRRFRYSNSGYFLLGLIIEKATGKPYAEALRERIFDPLGMRFSGCEPQAEPIEKRAAGYESRLDGYVNADYLDMSVMYAAGAAYSTVEDLYRWDRALAAGKIVSPELQQRMFTPFRPGEGYGYGLRIWSKNLPGARDQRHEIVGHEGGVNGFSSLIQRIPADDHLIAILDNTGSTQLGRIAEGIRLILYGEQPEYPDEPLSRELYLAYRDGGAERAIARYQEIKNAPEYGYLNDAAEWVRFAEAVGRSGELEDEISVLEIAVQEHSNSAVLAEKLGDALTKAGRPDEAFQAYRRALELHPRYGATAGTTSPARERVLGRLKKLSEYR